MDPITLAVIAAFLTPYFRKKGAEATEKAVEGVFDSRADLADKFKGLFKPEIQTLELDEQSTIEEINKQLKEHPEVQESIHDKVVTNQDLMDKLTELLRKQKGQKINANTYIEKVENIENANFTGEKPKKERVKNTVFVVYGRNSKARKAMFQFLRSIGLYPLEWSQAVEMTGKAAPYVGEILDKAFSVARAAVILFTPDDLAMLREDLRGKKEPIHETELTGQARSNVIFEAGMAMGLYPDRTVLVELGDLRPISDIAGRHVIRLNNSVARRQELAQRLKASGCEVNLSGIDWHEDGNFEIESAIIQLTTISQDKEISELQQKNIKLENEIKKLQSEFSDASNHDYAATFEAALRTNDNHEGQTNSEIQTGKPIKRNKIDVPQMRAESGTVTFDYSSYDGHYKIGKENYVFETKWGKSSKENIHCYNDPETIRGVALAPKGAKLEDIKDASKLDFTSRTRTPEVGRFVVLENNNGFYAAIEILDIRDDTRGDEKDELAFAFWILTDCSNDFSNIAESNVNRTIGA